MDDRDIEALNLLRELLKSQPHMFTQVNPVEAGGTALAKFVGAFIREYRTQTDPKGSFRQ